MFIVKKILILLISCLYLSSYTLFADSKTLTLGGKKGWPELEKMNGITTGKGRFGYTSLELSRNSPSVSNYTDLLLHFEDKEMNDSTGNYEIAGNDFILTDNAVIGKGAALSRGTGKGMLLRGRPGTMFGGGGRIGSFSIEFWLAPSIAENGERFLSWRSSRNMDNYSMYQTITATFSNNHLEWNFSNVFEGYTKNGGDVILSGTSTIIPDVWTRHKISYNEETGLLEYRMNGQTESLVYLTSTGHEGGDIYQMVLGVPADVALCPQYTGRIDDFRIVEMQSGEKSEDVSNSYDADRYDLYRVEGGRFETRPIRVLMGSQLNSIDTIMDIPPQTAVRLYVRSGDNYFAWTDSSPEWLPVESGSVISHVSGQFFQVAADLLPDGGGRTTPSITQLSLHYTETNPPLPPFSVRAVPGDGCVTVNWNYSADESAGGYYVYYGERPGEYLGRIAAEGSSPVNAGNTTTFTLNGLKNGTIYYFAVSTWSRYDKRINGPLSQEVFARPKKN